MKNYTTPCFLPFDTTGPDSPPTFQPQGAQALNIYFNILCLIICIQIAEISQTIINHCVALGVVHSTFVVYFLNFPSTFGSVFLLNHADGIPVLQQ
jgi:hypothetical protein